MMKKKWTTPAMSVQSVNMDKIRNLSRLSDAEVKKKLEEAGYKFQNQPQLFAPYICDSDKKGG